MTFSTSFIFTAVVFSAVSTQATQPRQPPRLFFISLALAKVASVKQGTKKRSERRKHCALVV